jgi:hypothetical protein
MQNEHKQLFYSTLNKLVPCACACVCGGEGENKQEIYTSHFPNQKKYNLRRRKRYILI